MENTEIDKHLLSRSREIKTRPQELLCDVELFREREIIRLFIPGFNMKLNSN